MTFPPFELDFHTSQSATSRKWELYVGIWEFAVEGGSDGQLLDGTFARSDVAPIRFDIRLPSERYLIRPWSGFTIEPLVLLPFFGCSCLVETALLFTSPCTFFLNFALWACYSLDVNFYSLSALCCVAICWSCLCQCSVCLLTCVCVCLLIYFRRSACDALVERTVKISRISLPGWNTKPTGFRSARASQVHVSPAKLVYGKWSSKGWMKYIYTSVEC